MQGVAARRNNFTEPILQFLEEAYAEFGKLTGRYYGLITRYKTDDAETVFVSLGSAAENIEAAVGYSVPGEVRRLVPSTSTSFDRSRKQRLSKHSRARRRHRP